MFTSIKLPNLIITYISLAPFYSSVSMWEQHISKSEQMRGLIVIRMFNFHTQCRFICYCNTIITHPMMLLMKNLFLSLEYIVVLNNNFVHGWWYIDVWVVCLMVFNVTFNNISVISWQSVLLVEKTREPRENHQPVMT
jgi:hypothetical protein